MSRERRPDTEANKTYDRQLAVTAGLGAVASSVFAVSIMEGPTAESVIVGGVTGGLVGSGFKALEIHKTLRADTPERAAAQARAINRGRKVVAAAAGALFGGLQAAAYHGGNWLTALTAGAIIGLSASYASSDAAAGLVQRMQDTTPDQAPPRRTGRRR